MRKSILFSILICGLNSYAFGRITSSYVDIGKPITFYLYPGRSALIDFPCSIISATPGPGKDVELKVGTTNAKEVHIFLKSGGSQATNMLVRCQDAVFVFDIIPSQQKHQDYLQIAGYYGSPNFEGVKSSKNRDGNSADKADPGNSNKNSTQSTASKSHKISNINDLDQLAKTLNQTLRK